MMWMIVFLMVNLISKDLQTAHLKLYFANIKFLYRKKFFCIGNQMFLVICFFSFAFRLWLFTVNTISQIFELTYHPSLKMIFLLHKHLIFQIKLKNLGKMYFKCLRNMTIRDGKRTRRTPSYEGVIANPYGKSKTFFKKSIVIYFPVSPLNPTF